MRKIFMGSLACLSLMGGLCSNSVADGASALQGVADLAEPSVGNGTVGKIQRYSGALDKTVQRNAVANDDLNARTRSECRFKVIADRRPNIISLNPENGIVDDAELAARLDSLYRQGKIAAIFSKQFSGRPEALADKCAVYLFRIFTVDGYWLQIFFDHRD